MGRSEARSKPRTREHVFTSHTSLPRTCRTAVAELATRRRPGPPVRTVPRAVGLPDSAETTLPDAVAADGKGCDQFHGRVSSASSAAARVRSRRDRVEKRPSIRRLIALSEFSPSSTRGKGEGPWGRHAAGARRFPRRRGAREAQEAARILATDPTAQLGWASSDASSFARALAIASSCHATAPMRLIE